MGIRGLRFNKRAKQFNSRNYDLNLVVDNDEYEFLKNTLGSFHDLDIIKELATVTAPAVNKANIHVETNDKTLIKWLIKFGFKEAK